MIKADGICKQCAAPAVPFGLFCAVCYGRELSPDGQPLYPGTPGDPWRAFNAEADALILDRQMPEWLTYPRATPTPPATDFSDLFLGGVLMPKPPEKKP